MQIKLLNTFSVYNVNMAAYRLASALKLHENEIMKHVAEKKMM